MTIRGAAMVPSTLPVARTSTRSEAWTSPITRPPTRTTGAVTGPSITPSAPTITGASTRTSPTTSPSTRTSVAPPISPRSRVPAAM